MILTHESGAREDQFDGKKWRPKISWDYPFKYIDTEHGKEKSRTSVLASLTYTLEF
jgi:hypothetical protein